MANFESSDNLKCVLVLVFECGRKPEYTDSTQRESTKAHGENADFI